LSASILNTFVRIEPAARHSVGPTPLSQSSSLLSDRITLNPGADRIRKNDDVTQEALLDLSFCSAGGLRAREQRFSSSSNLWLMLDIVEVSPGQRKRNSHRSASLPHTVRGVRFA
jgi:hypothetical protein